MNKNSLGGLWSPLRKLQQHIKTKSLRITEEKEKENSFILPASSRAPSQRGSKPKGSFPARKSCPHLEEKSWVCNQFKVPLKLQSASDGQIWDL